MKNNDSGGSNNTSKNGGKNNDEYSVVAYPYKKFFNYNEKFAAKLNWNQPVRVYEKLDGSLCTLYYYDGQWWVSSSGAASADGFLDSAKMKFSDLFWDIWHKKLKYQLPTDTSKCYMFEMVTQRHIILVRPSDEQPERIILHGVRKMTTLEEEYPDQVAQDHGWECVTYFSMKNIDEVVSASKTLNPIQCEGYVVCDSNFNRVKVKSPQYVALSHMSTRSDKVVEITDKRRMLQVVRFHEGDEFLSYFPAYKDVHQECQDAYNRFIRMSSKAVTPFVELCKETGMMHAHQNEILDQYCSLWESEKKLTITEFRSNKKTLRFLNALSKHLHIFLADLTSKLPKETDVDIEAWLMGELQSFWARSSLESSDLYSIVFMGEPTSDNKDKHRAVKESSNEDIDDDEIEREEVSDKPQSSTSELKYESDSDEMTNSRKSARSKVAKKEEADQSTTQ